MGRRSPCSSTPSSPYKTIQDVIDAAKANPGKVRSGTTGHMATGHFANLEFQRGAGVRMATVHFQGGGPALTALLGGHIDVAFNSIGELLTPLKNGQIRILAVMDDKESEFLPGVKTLAALGVKANPIGSDIGLAAPAGVPKEIVAKLSATLKKAMNDESLQKEHGRARQHGALLDPDEYGKFWDDVDTKYAPLIELGEERQVMAESIYSRSDHRHRSMFGPRRKPERDFAMTTSTATMRLTYQITGAVLLCFSIYVGVEALELRYYTSLGPGPGFFSCWLSLILGILSSP